MQERFVKTRLVFVSDNEDIFPFGADSRRKRLSVVIGFPFMSALSSSSVYSVPSTLTEPENATMALQPRLSFGCAFIFDRKEIAHGVGTAVGNDHCLSPAADLKPPVFQEIRHDHVRFLRDRIAVFLVIAHERAKSRPFDEFGIVLRNTHEAERLLMVV